MIISLVPKSSKHWMLALIKKLWELAWDHCNKELHSGGSAQQNILHLAINAQIEVAYLGGAQQPHRDALHLV